MLLNCYEELLKDHPKNDLVLVWDAPEEIRARYNHPRIHFTGKVKDSTLSDLYNCATSTIYPSLYEGFGLPVLESLSCGTPVICSDVTSLPEVGGEHCKYINPLDPSALTQEMMNFENNVYDLKKMSDDGIKHAQKYTWEKCANETLNVYRSLVK
jgi:glycosyltransferase involved in cell wall biosynthesis